MLLISFTSIEPATACVYLDLDPPPPMCQYELLWNSKLQIKLVVLRYISVMFE